MCGRSIWQERARVEESGETMTASQLQHVPFSTMPVSRCAGRTVGDPRLLSMYVAYSDIVAADEPLTRTKARLSELSAYGNVQGLTGRAAFDGLRRLSIDLHEELMDTRRFSVFYRFVFFMCREHGQKSISPSTAVDAWRVALTGRFRLLDQWCAFVKGYQRQAISEDTWRQVLEFSRSVHEDLSNYDPEGAWPVLVDEFVDKMYSSQLINICDTDVASPTKRQDEDHVTTPCKRTILPGMLISTGSKRRRRDCRDTAEQAESVNSIAQLFAEMPSPLSCKRVRTNESLVDNHDPMDESLELSRLCEGRGRVPGDDEMTTGSFQVSSDGSTGMCFPRTVPPSTWPTFLEKGLVLGPDVPVSWSSLS